jgi:hypothetical protein
MKGTQHEVEDLQNMLVNKPDFVLHSSRVTMKVRRTKSKGKTMEAASNIASTGLPLVGLSIMKPHFNPHDECDRESYIPFQVLEQALECITQRAHP